jgi:hypothetical protein
MPCVGRSFAGLLDINLDLPVEIFLWYETGGDILKPSSQTVSGKSSSELYQSIESSRAYVVGVIRGNKGTAWNIDLYR